MNWAYLAGFTDGDGCITREVAKGKYPYARVRWNQKLSDSQVLEEIAQLLRSKGLKVTRRNFSVALRGHKFPQAELGITNADDTRKVLEEMVPYLVVKRQRAIEALTVLRYASVMKRKFGWKYRVAAKKAVNAPYFPELREVC